jgi:hypothetical protein
VQWNPKHDPIPLRTEETPQLQHIRDHLRGSQRGLNETDLDEYMHIVRLLCEPRTLESIADSLEGVPKLGGHRDSPNWTRRMIETRWYNIAEVLLMTPGDKKTSKGFSDYGAQRIGLVLQVYGLKPCWCDF